MNFESFNFHPTLMAGIRAMRYKTPTAIQVQALPPALAGRDTVGLAPIGAGKTAAYALLVLQRLRADEKEGVRALVISSSQESAGPALELINTLGGQTGLESLGLYEGLSMEKQLRGLRYRPAIVVASPGRLMDHLWKGSIKLMDLEVLVIDDADSMLDAGFISEIRNILGYIDHRYQILLFSATMPDGLQRFIREALHDPVTVRIDVAPGSKSVPPARVRLGQYLNSRQRQDQSG